MDTKLKSVAMNIIQWNSQSIRPKLSELEALLIRDQVHIAIISETWLEENSFLKISQYNIYRKDRHDSYGGVAILLHTSIKSELKLTSCNNKGIEIVHIKIENCKYLENIFSIYCPPSIQTRRDDWDQLFSFCASKTLVAGDFNGHHPNWSSKCDARGNQIMDAALEYGFISINNGSATRMKYVNNNLQQTSPDITFTSSDIAIHFTWTVLSENLGSDHLILKIKIMYQDTFHVIRKRNFKKAKWQAYSKDIETSIAEFNYVSSASDTQQMYSNFIFIINRSADTNIPLIKVCSDPQKNFKPKPYWNSSLSKVVAERRLALKQFRRNPTPENLATLENKTLTARNEIRQSKNINWQRFCTSIDNTITSSDMWRKMRWIKGYKQTSNYVPIDRRNDLIRRLTPDSVQRPKPLCISSNKILETEFTLQELEACIKKKDTAPGCDNITYSMIFHLPVTAKQILLRLFNDIFNYCYIPNEWRDIKVIAIPKVGNSYHSNLKLRPISLISCICKVFHLMLSKRLEWFVERNRLFSPSTTGFRRGQSCMDSLAQLITSIQIGFTKNISTLACFIDIDNAYNNVLIESVVKTLDDLKVGSRICYYLWEFLRERRLSIKDESEDSSNIVRWTNLGLAQGDPLSPLLFNIVTHNICKSSSTEICQYADDFVFFVSCKNLNDSVNKMQNSLDNTVAILSNLGLEISTTKSLLCLFSRGNRNSSVQLFINNVPLVATQNVKYLGMWLDSSLRWGMHLNELSQKCQKMLNIIKVLSGSGWGTHPMHLRHLYLSLVRSRMDYGCFLYGSSFKSQLYKLDKVQNQAMRIIGGFIRTTPIHVMESELCIPPLHLRRKYLAIKYCLKVKSWTSCTTSTLLSELCSLSANTYWKNKKKPILMDTFNIIGNIKIYSTNPLDMFKLSTWCSNIAIKNVIKISLENIKKPKMSYEINCLRNDVLLELNQVYKGWYKLFTDGSKSTETGAAFYDPVTKSNSCYKIVSEVSIMTAELFAISEALSYANNLQQTNVVIITDSKSALQHLARCASGHRGVSIAFAVLSKIYFLLRNNVHIVLQWVPSHIGLKGNEEADRLAKRAAISGLQIYILPIYSEILSQFKKHCYDEWKTHFDDICKCKGIWYKIIQNEPPRFPWFNNYDLNRNVLVTAHRLRSGHMPLNGFAFLMKKVNSPNCQVCNMVEDVHHRLMECVRNEAERNIIIKKLNVNKLDLGAFTNVLSRPTSREAKMLYALVKIPT